MKKFNLAILFFVLIMSCSKDSTKEETVDINLEFTQFEVTLSTGEKSIGIIDNDNNSITLPNITDPSEIISVTYQYSDDVKLITPKPETRIGEWKITEKFRLHTTSYYKEFKVSIPDYEKPTYTNKATIAPLERFGRVTKYHLLDINHNPGTLSNIDRANLVFGQAGMNGLRIPIYCGDYYGGHPEEGVVVESVYATALKSIENAKLAYNGSEPFMIFAGLKVMTSNKAEYYPDWVTTEIDNVANPIKYAQLVVDYIKFMHEKGHTINAFAFDKEAARMDVEDFKIAVDTLRARTARLGYVVPKIVAPELYKPLGQNGPMDDLYDANGESHFDVFGNHYYQGHHNVNNFPDLKYEYDLAQSDTYREAWATEAHWDGLSCSSAYENATDLWTGETALGCMFDWTDLGLDLLSWWDYPISGGNSPRHYIIRAYSEALINSQPIRMLDHDGEETLTRWKLHSRAYIKGNEVNVFFINVVNPCVTDFTPISYEEYPIGILDGFKIDGNISVTQWDNNDEPEGNYISILPNEDNQFLLDIPHGSITHVSFNITE
ncbi:hypothetical protein ACFFU9_05110 [Mariniflexile ostreae]|uniref:Uncharacterized protein n=1 Tax=Mariniflexile ostreae TaxID=1520892 RepID=A0ABV5F9J6_9FLAO